MQHTDTDVAIIGASMAGSCLARQLKLKHPQLKITVLERKQKFDSWVGESTLESFWDYAAKDLKLGYYLESNYLYKHGLRFYFDSPEKDLKLSEMSELGRRWNHGIPAHHLRRDQFDTDMCRMNQDIGIDVQLGCQVKKIELDGASGHLLQTSNGSVKCRYLVDAAGFAAPVGKQLDLVESMDHRHPISSYWGRFKNTQLIDHLGNDDWRERTNFTSRALATNHFMYKGYWIWLIPLDSETVSIGVTVRNDMADVTIKGSGAFEDFLKSHTCLQELLGEQYELLDFKAMKRLTRRAKQSFSTDRWFLTGMSSAFIDPFLSPGCAYLTDTNRMIGELIEADLADDQATFEGKTKAYNAYAKLWFEGFLLHSSGTYHGSYETHSVHFEALLMHWYGAIFPSSLAQFFGYDPAMNEMSQQQLNDKVDMMMEQSAISKINLIKNQFLERIDGVDKRKNQGQFFDMELGKHRMRLAHSRGKLLSEAQLMQVDEEMLEVSFKGYLRSLCDIEQISISDTKLNDVTMMAVKQDMCLNTAFEHLSM